MIHTYIYCSGENNGGNIPDWVHEQWKVTSKMSGYIAVWADETPVLKQCTTVGFMNRGSKITAANCNWEVADTLCQEIS